jgi:lysyl-tRNA synthetase class 2
MTNDHLTHDLSSKRAVLELRAAVMREIRRVFVAQGFLEVETPVRVKTPALEEHIDAEASGSKWLRTSPELHMKRMVAAGYDKIFQIGPCFRQGERGARHLPEYTMLEWYWSGAESADLIPQTIGLLRGVAEAVGKPGAAGLDQKPLEITVAEVFQTRAGWNPVEAFDADRFDLDLVEKVEPWISEQERPVFLKDFPAERAALARFRAEDPAVADRWELYLGGMELANAYTELTDPAEQRERFERCAALRRKEGREVYPLDEPFLMALERGMPACAGIALGVDRFLMLLAGEKDISGVVAFVD